MLTSSAPNGGRHTQVAKGTVCKTVIRRFESAWRLHSNSRLTRAEILGAMDPRG